ncbi:hypothetical protein BDN72DRAFT_129230 [Pluteus cervinus]|uniref:Uncharacterized protein n=1 Tax=Pluteus cervinus TaxID=181527 RepID=A0ACD3AMA3_9AGAR|nr:hypothetical protein BDN72DRAFT_129230 [Pluteus cervinus]
MGRYPKRDPVFVASLFPKSSRGNWDLFPLLSSVSEAITNVCELCTKPMLLVNICADISHRDTGRGFRYHGSWSLEVSIIETGHATRIPRYRTLHDPTRPRLRTISPPRSVPALTANPSSSNNQQLVLIPKKTYPPKFGPNPPPVLPPPNSKPGSPSDVSRIPRHKNTLSRPVSPSSSSRELTISQRLEELTSAVKSQGALLESMARRLG